MILNYFTIKSSNYVEYLLLYTNKNILKYFIFNKKANNFIVTNVCHIKYYHL